MDLLATFVVDVARQTQKKTTKAPPSPSPLPVAMTAAATTTNSDDVSNKHKIYNEYMHKYMSRHIPSTYKYVAVLSMPVAAMFITISWRNNVILFKIIITLLTVIHIVLVSNFVEYSMVA